MGPYEQRPRSVSCDRATRYAGLGVRSVGPVGDFLEILDSSAGENEDHPKSEQHGTLKFTCLKRTLLFPNHHF